MTESGTKSPKDTARSSEGFPWKQGWALIKELCLVGSGDHNKVSQAGGLKQQMFKFWWLEV